MMMMTMLMHGVTDDSYMDDGAGDCRSFHVRLSATRRSDVLQPRHETPIRRPRLRPRIPLQHAQVDKR